MPLLILFFLANLPKIAFTLGLVSIFALTYYNLFDARIDTIADAYNALADPVINGETVPMLAFLSMSGMPGAIGIVITGIFYRIAINISFLVVNTLT